MHRLAADASGEEGRMLAASAAWLRRIAAECEAITAMTEQEQPIEHIVRAVVKTAENLQQETELLLQASRAEHDSREAGSDSIAPAADGTGAGSIRSSVAAFREKLRAEHAERAKQAAEDRRRFIERLRAEAGVRSERVEAPAKPVPDVSDEAAEVGVDQETPQTADRPAIRFRQVREREVASSGQVVDQTVAPMRGSDQV
ncbi:MAG: hypothetical protein AAFO89_10430 [Planctomycetota bacterium]